MKPGSLAHSHALPYLWSLSFALRSKGLAWTEPKGWGKLRTEEGRTVADPIAPLGGLGPPGGGEDSATV